MAKSKEMGMQTFDQALFELYKQHRINYADALHHADSPNDLRLMIKLQNNEQKGAGFLQGVTIDGLDGRVRTDVVTNKFNRCVIAVELCAARAQY